MLDRCTLYPADGAGGFERKGGFKSLYKTPPSRVSLDLDQQFHWHKSEERETERDRESSEAAPGVDRILNLTLTYPFLPHFPVFLSIPSPQFPTIVPALVGSPRYADKIWKSSGLSTGTWALLF